MIEPFSVIAKCFAHLSLNGSIAMESARHGENAIITVGNLRAAREWDDRNREGGVK